MKEVAHDATSFALSYFSRVYIECFPEELMVRLWDILEEN